MYTCLLVLYSDIFMHVLSIIYYDYELITIATIFIYILVVGNIYITYIWSRVPCSHPPPWDGGGMMPLWWCIYIHTYLPTYLRTYIHTYHYITLPYITLPYLLPYLTFHTYIHTITIPYLTLHYLTLHSIHTYLHTYIHIQTHTHTYIHTYIPYHTIPYHTIPLHYITLHTNIPTYQHTTTTGHRGGDQKNHTTTTGHRGGDQKNQTILSTHTHWWGGEGGWPTLHHYIYIYIYIYVCTCSDYPDNRSPTTSCWRNAGLWRAGASLSFSAGNWRAWLAVLQWDISGKWPIP